jgi:hypothetical protein
VVVQEDKEADAEGATENDELASFKL